MNQLYQVKRDQALVAQELRKLKPVLIIPSQKKLCQVKTRRSRLQYFSSGNGKPRAAAEILQYGL
jgi:hypothetical protein